jgi:defect in organelle trafficking protein DotB
MQPAKNLKIEGEALYPDEPSFFTSKDTEGLMAHCFALKASDITITTNREVIVDVYGRLLRATRKRLTNVEVLEIIAGLFKNDSGPARLNGGHDLDFAFEMRPTRDERLRFRVNATAISVEGQNGAQITVRTIPGIPPSIDSLGVEPEILQSFAPKQGLVLVAGATGSGKSTLLSAGIRRLLEDPDGNHKIVTYESPVEFVYDDVEQPSSVITQSEIGKHLGSFADGVRNALRRKPTIILVGEARDAETVGECVTASMTGHLTYSTVHANGVAETIRRMVNVFPENEKHARAVDIITSVKMIISQMLLPSTDGKRVALREFLVFNERMVDELIVGGVDQLTLVARNILKRDGQTFLADATRKYKDGIIAEREFRRIQALSQGMDRDVEF